MSQKDTLLLSAAAVQVSGLVPGLVDNPRGIVRLARINTCAVRHSYYGEGDVRYGMSMKRVAYSQWAGGLVRAALKEGRSIFVGAVWERQHNG